MNFLWDFILFLFFCWSAGRYCIPTNKSQKQTVKILSFCTKFKILIFYIEFKSWLDFRWNRPENRGGGFRECEPFARIGPNSALLPFKTSENAKISFIKWPGGGQVQVVHWLRHIFFRDNFSIFFEEFWKNKEYTSYVKISKSGYFSLVSKTYIHILLISQTV